MTAAELTLRFGAARLRAHVCWPSSPGSLTLLLADRAELAGALASTAATVVVALKRRESPEDELAALEWVAEHAAELGAPERLLIAGGARAAVLAIRARDGGWPAIHRQVLVLPLFTDEHPMPSNVARVAPATVLSAGNTRDDGGLYASRLRAAGVEVDEPTAFTALGRSLR